MNSKHKLLSVILAIVMVLAYVPQFAMAEDNNLIAEQNNEIEEIITDSDADADDSDAIAAGKEVAVEEKSLEDGEEKDNEEELGLQQIGEEKLEKELALNSSASDNYGNLTLDYTYGPIYTDGTKTFIINDDSFTAVDYSFDVYLYYYYNGQSNIIEEASDCYSLNNKELTLYGDQLWEKLRRFGECSITVQVAALKDDEYIGFAYGYTTIKEPYADYEECFPYDDEEIAGSYYEINKHNVSRYYSGKIPQTDPWPSAQFEFDITSVSVNGKEVECNDNDIYIFPIALGANDVSLTYTLLDLASGEMTADTAVYNCVITGVSDSYYIGVTKDGDENEYRVELIPGETVTFIARGEHVFLGNDGTISYDYNFNYNWNIEQGKDYVDIIKIETDPARKWSRATVKVKESIDPFYFGDEGQIDVYVAANLVSKSSGEVYANRAESLFIVTDYCEVCLSSQIPSNMSVGSSVTVTPVTKWHWYYWNDYTNKGQSVVSELNYIKYGWTFDDNKVSIKNQGGYIEEYQGYEDQLYSGSFTITRKRNEWAYMSITAYSYDDEQEMWTSLDTKELLLYQTTPIDTVEVSGIVDKVYNGTPQTQAIILKEFIEEDGESWWYTLEEGEDYSVSYTNNVYPGTATIVIKGLKTYNGTITRTFKITGSVPNITSITPAEPTEIVDLPAVKISKPKAAKKKITVKWKKVSKANLKKIGGIQIEVATDPGFTSIVKTATAGKKKTSKVIKGLSPKTKYYVRIRAYAAGNHVSVWKSKSVKVK